jgi:hypothetical protein
MHVLLRWVARVAGIFGVAVMALAVIGRLGGAFWLGAFQVGTILQGGMAATLVACLAYLAVLVEPVRSK